MPRGGARPGAGRKPKDAETARLHGSRRHEVVRFPSAAAATAPVALPRGLPPAAKTVWKELGPFAQSKGTLVAGTATAFGMFCRAVVLERQLAKSHDAGGSNHRGMMQRVEAGMVRFGLAPIGKPMVTPEQRQSKVDAFREQGKVRA